MSEYDLVTVVIPAFNAARTIGETLRSVRSQTHRRLEILIVDDGSVDATPQIVERHAAKDDRVRLIRQTNAGVAAARNRGIAEAVGDLVAPIDADDLWRPDKIEKQLAALHRGGPTVAVVYTWSADIDENSRIIGDGPGPRHSGTVTYEICCKNFIGNGSNTLMRRKAIVEAGGYDPSLRARSAEGVEDWQIYFRIATRHEFAVVPEALTGYRRLANAMSTDVLRMLRGRDLVADEMCSRYPEWTADIKIARFGYLQWQYDQALHLRRAAEALMAAILIIRESPLQGVKHVLLVPTRFMLHRFGMKRSVETENVQVQHRRFPIGSPTACDPKQPHIARQ